MSFEELDVYLKAVSYTHLVKLAKEIGQAKAAKELGIPKNTMYCLLYTSHGKDAV